MNLNNLYGSKTIETAEKNRTLGYLCINCKGKLVIFNILGGSSTSEITTNQRKNTWQKLNF